MAPANGESKAAAAEWAAVLLILALAAALRFYHLGQTRLWMDEQTNYGVARQQTLSALWNAGLDNGPLGFFDYFVDAAGIRTLGETRSGLRAPHAVFGIAAVLATFLLARRWFGTRVALLAAGLTCVHGVHIQYSREARPYALMTLTAVLAAWQFDALVRKMSLRNALVFCGLALGIFCIHPFAALTYIGLALGMLLALFWRAAPVENRRWPRVVALCAGGVTLAAFVAYLIWYRWMPPHKLGHVRQAVAFIPELTDIGRSLVGGYWGIPAYGAAAACVAAVASVLRKTDWRWPILLCVGIALMSIVPVVMSAVGRVPVCVRYSLFALPFICMLIAVGINRALSCLKPFRDNESIWTRVLPGPVLALALLTLAFAQGRSPYNLERDKCTSYEFPNLEQP